ncbi:HNH endonuclease [Agrobacterium larrymoorei]|uniref:HNH endonuclease n=1 Tax=Agrobacterium larrymoorei TaxID=160699 RepID=A0A4D7DVZ6_9HYPH|nr:HNH endonuclease [Agrobacterium larrymoorei]QCI98849.1 HNH endonuclease [Agrobacterium larrymoorei]QYA08263.1 HNH endonuclease [Agrobacterium larrymoorei]
MSRKKFIQSLGATCSNWTWSWSFVNNDARFVVFGLWQDKDDGKLGLILHKNWEHLGERKQYGYAQAIRHIQLVEKESYKIYTFPMVGERRDPARGELSPSAISKFTPVTTERLLVPLPHGWYVAPLSANYETVAEIVKDEDEYGDFIEGAVSPVLVNAYERNPHARKACIAHYGAACQACGLDFGTIYGPLGSGYIHVHHVRPIHLRGGAYVVNPVRDLIPLCANCHAMVHRGSEPLTVDELRCILDERRRAVLPQVHSV